MKFEITNEQFLNLGFYVFFLVGILSIGQLIYNFSSQNPLGVGISLIFIIFYFIIAAYFNYMRKSSNPEITEEYAAEDIKEIMDKIKNEQDR